MANKAFVYLGDANGIGSVSTELFINCNAIVLDSNSQVVEYVFQEQTAYVFTAQVFNSDTPDTFRTRVTAMVRTAFNSPLLPVTFIHDSKGAL